MKVYTLLRNCAWIFLLAALVVSWWNPIVEVIRIDPDWIAIPEQQSQD